MKKIYKIFMAVAAVAGVTACTTDVTEDLGVNLNEGPTTLTLSLDDTRTQLGVKGEDETTYPLTWAAGDAISVNGSVSNALTADKAGATTATFNFEKGFGSAPYFVAYPAVEGTTNQVVFAAEQTHTSNTSFGNNATVMYGYTTDLNSVKLNHLTGVLKIGVVSDNEETLKSVRISTVDRKPIAGAFNATYNAKTEKMELTPVNGATSDVITYTFSEGVDLKSEPTYIHVAVPAGTYGELYVTLEAETEKAMDDIGMNIQKTTAYSYKTVVTDSTKPLNAGTVREFSTNLPFEPANEETDYVIASYDDLKKFKTAVEGGNTRNAVLVNDIEVGDDWASINAPEYAAEFNGNGYAIKGLKAPLFNATAATIKGVHLKNVDIDAANTAVEVAALVCKYSGGNISHCSVDGTIDITGITHAKNKRIGGLVGVVNIDNKVDVEISDCVNSCDITANFTDQSRSTSVSTSLGGILGGIGTNGNYANAAAASSNKLTAKNNINEGTIALTGSTKLSNISVGGIVGRLTHISVYIENCTNSGEIISNMSQVDTDPGTNESYIGGIAGYSDNSFADYTRSIKNCSNLANVKMDVDNFNQYFYIAGCIGKIYINKADNTIIEGFENRGIISSNITNISGLTTQNGRANCVAGIIGYIQASGTGGTVTINKIINKAEVKYEGLGANASSTTHKNNWVWVGGIIARVKHSGTRTYTVQNLINTGNITAAFGGGQGASTSYAHFGGIIGELATQIKITDTQCHCKVTAYVKKTDGKYSRYNSTGVLTGSYPTNNGLLLENVKVGGNISYGNSKTTLDIYTLKSDNYIGYSFGMKSGSRLTATSYTGLSFLESKDNIDYTTVQ